MSAPRLRRSVTVTPRLREHRQEAVGDLGRRRAVRRVRVRVHRDQVQLRRHAAQQRDQFRAASSRVVHARHQRVLEEDRVARA